MRAWRHRPETFLFPTETDSWLTCLRIGLGLQVFLYALSLRGDWNYFFGGADAGLNGRALSEALLSIESPFIPRLGWLVTWGRYLALPENIVLGFVWSALLLAAVGLLVGITCRVCAVVAWCLHLCVAESGGLTAYGVDSLMTIGLFYLMLSPLPDRSALDYWLRHKSPKRRELLGFWRRILQLHLCLIYFFSGLTKCLGSGWWDGSNLWRALIRPPFNIMPAEILVRWKYFFPLAGIVIWLLELGYPIFIWPKRTRFLWLGCILFMHAGIALVMGMYLFALVMIVLNIAAFGTGVQMRAKNAEAVFGPKGVV